MKSVKNKLRIKPGMGLVFALIGALLLTGCAMGILGANIKPGETSLAQIEQSVGKPDMVWRNSQGNIIQAAYSNQPAGFVTFMMYFNDQGVVTRMEQVMDLRHYVLVKDGMTGDEVHKILGPERTVEHYTGLHQIDWNYGYCSASNYRQIHSVSFDDRTMLVNGSITTPDPLYTMGDNEPGWCSPYFPGETYVR